MARFTHNICAIIMGFIVVVSAIRLLVMFPRVVLLVCRCCCCFVFSSLLFLYQRLPLSIVPLSSSSSFRRAENQPSDLIVTYNTSLDAENVVHTQFKDTDREQRGSRDRENFGVFLVVQ